MLHRQEKTPQRSSWVTSSRLKRRRKKLRKDNHPVQKIKMLPQTVKKRKIQTRRRVESETRKTKKTMNLKSKSSRKTIKEKLKPRLRALARRTPVRRRKRIKTFSTKMNRCWMLSILVIVTRFMRRREARPKRTNNTRVRRTRRPRKKLKRRKRSRPRKRLR